MNKKAYYRKIPIYFNPENNQITGRNWFYEILLNINIWIDIKIVGIEEFPILMEEDKDKK